MQGRCFSLSGFGKWNNIVASNWSILNNFQGLWVNFAKDQLFCLLGPNGAGKTTAINCLTGNTPVTGGDGNTIIFFLSALIGKFLRLWCQLGNDNFANCLVTALIYGNSARSSVGMANIRKIIGFCPQVLSSLSLSRVATTHLKILTQRVCILSPFIVRYSLGCIDWARAPSPLR